MPHAPADTASKPRRQRRTPPPTPPHQHAPTDASGSTPSVKPPRVHGGYTSAPLHGSAHPQLDQILARGAGPLRFPTGKLNLPAAPPPPPVLPEMPPLRVPPPERGAHREVTQQELAHAQALVDAADANAANQPSLIREATHKHAVIQSFLPLATVVTLPPGPLRELFQSINDAKTRAQVFANLPQADSTLRDAARQIVQLEEPHGALQRIEHNFLPDALHTPQGIFLGTYELGRAGRQALPSALGGKGDPRALEQAANEMIAPLEHPSEFVQEHPFQALISLSGVGRAAGAVAGTAARTGLAGDALAEALSGNAAREIISPVETATAGTDATPISRTITDGRYSRNALDQLVQRARDTHASHSTGAFDRRVAKQGDELLRLREALKGANTRDRINPVAQALHQASLHERVAALYAHGQGLRPSDFVNHYTQRLADLRTSLHAATGQHRGEIRRDIGYAEQALQAWTKIHAKLGDRVTEPMQGIMDAFRGSVAERENELRQLGLLDDQQMQAARAQPQNIILPPDEARIANPFYVRHAPLQRNLLHPRRAPRRSSSPLAAREGTVQTRTGALLRSGNLDLSPRPQLERLAQPGDAATAAHYLNDLRDKHGVHVSPGDTFDPVREQLVSASTNANATMTSGWDVFRENVPQQHSTGVVPEGDWMLVPKPLYEQRVAQFAPSEQDTLGRYGHQLTNAFRWYALSARPAWLVSNMVGNAAQAALAGAGPLSVYRAIDRSGRITRHLPGRDYTDVIPRTVPYQGMISQLLRPKRGLVPRSDRLPANPLRVANVTTENWMRRAVYLRYAIPEYGHDINALTAARTAEERAPHVVKIVDRFLGHFSHGKNRYAALVPFLGWLKFITNHTLVQLPLHHPARALLLQRLGSLGMAAQQVEGLQNQSIEGAIPAGEGDMGPVGQTTNFIRTGSINPWATVSQLGSFDPAEPTGQPNFQGGLSAVNPFAQALYTTLSGREFSNPDFSGPASLSPNDRAAYLLGQILGTAPLTRLIDPRLRIGQAPTSPLQQPSPSLLQRLLGYNLVGISPVDTQLANVKNVKRLVSNFRAQAPK